MMIKEHDIVALAIDLPEHHLNCDDIGTIVLVHAGGGYEVEFATLRGETVAVVSLSPDQVRPLGHREIAHARKVEAAS